MAGIPLFLLLLTAREGRLSAEDCRAVRPSALRCGHSGRRCAFVRADDETGALLSVKTGAPAVVLDRR